MATHRKKYQLPSEGGHTFFWNSPKRSLFSYEIQELFWNCLISFNLTGKEWNKPFVRPPSNRKKYVYQYYTKLFTFILHIGIQKSNNPNEYILWYENHYDLLKKTDLIMQFISNLFFFFFLSHWMILSVWDWKFSVSVKHIIMLQIKTMSVLKILTFIHYH